jgi:Flp pilus assembly protein TadD
LAVWDRLIAASPDRPAWLADRAVARALAGDREGAVADLRRALRLDPRNLAAGLSLISLLESAGRKSEFRQACRQALAAPGPGSDRKLLAMLRAQCAGPGP